MQAGHQDQAGEEELPKMRNCRHSAKAACKWAAPRWAAAQTHGRGEEGAGIPNASKDPRFNLLALVVDEQLVARISRCWMRER